MNAVAKTIDHEQQNTSLAPITPMEMLDRAVASGAGIETLERLMSLQERWEKNQARKAFDDAMAAAKAEIPVISKNRRVGYEHKDGRGETSYRHEDLGEIARTVDPILTKYGLSYRFRTTSETNQPVSVTCIVAHRDGHSEENTLTAGRDDSGKKNSIQAIGSTITYLQRYTLKAALGLAASSDDDGGKADQTVDNGPISEDQAKAIRDLIETTGTDIAKFCEYLKVDAVPDIPASEFPRVIAMLEKKRASK
jgi:hypothetical protein